MVGGCNNLMTPSEVGYEGVRRGWRGYAKTILVKIDSPHSFSNGLSVGGRQPIFCFRNVARMKRPSAVK
jgi:hypothetical protein